MYLWNSMPEFFTQNDTKTALEAQYEAQKIAFAPIIFQVARSMRDLGVLELLYDHAKEGVSLEVMVEKMDLSSYALTVMLETALSADIVKCSDKKYYLTKTGYFLLKDEMTRINMDYNHDVNYLGLYSLDEALQKEEAIGLKVFGDWTTIYPALSSLPEKAQKSWFAFDHYYSDTAFNEAIDILLKTSPKKILDIGGNTGKFSIQLAKKDNALSVTIFDLPEQIALAEENIKKESLEARVHFHSGDVLDTQSKIPSDYDIVWMSQFLDCFKEEDIVRILKKVKESMGEETLVYIMEPLWDRQRFETSAYCIINTSPYFTAMANGYSKMFNAKEMTDIIEKAGLEVIESIDNVGICQSILVCR